MAEKIELKAFKIALSKDEKRKIRNMLLDFRKDVKVRSVKDSLTTVVDEHTENIVNFIETLIIDNKPVYLFRSQRWQKK